MTDFGTYLPRSLPVRPQIHVNIYGPKILGQWEN